MYQFTFHSELDNRSNIKVNEQTYQLVITNIISKLLVPEHFKYRDDIEKYDNCTIPLTTDNRLFIINKLHELCECCKKYTHVNAELKCLIATFENEIHKGVQCYADSVPKKSIYSDEFLKSMMFKGKKPYKGTIKLGGE